MQQIAIRIKTKGTPPFLCAALTPQIFFSHNSCLAAFYAAAGAAGLNQHQRARSSPQGWACGRDMTPSDTSGRRQFKDPPPALPPLIVLKEDVTESDIAGMNI